MKYLYFVLVIFSTTALFGQQDYENYKGQVERMKSLQKSNSRQVELKELAKTNGGQSVYVLILSNGNPKSNPGIVVTGGVDGSQISSTEMALKFAEQVMSTDSLRQQLSEITYYVFPNMSPDATEQYFNKLKYNRSVNASVIDNDRDGRTDEDGYEDLNADGLITMMRIKDSKGAYRISDEDNRLMVKAKISEGETGEYLLVTEGVDNDNDGQYNEDGPGGVNFNSNFTYQYPWFTSEAGEYQVSEPESRKMLDLLYEHRNIFLFVTFGPSNNLMQPERFNASQARKRVVSSYLQPDVELNERISKLYKELTGIEGGEYHASPGDFYQWAYYHFGRQSYSTPAYSYPVLDKKKSSEYNQLKWMDSVGINGFSNWEAVEHASFKGKKVEVGGFKPFIQNNIPISSLNETSAKHTQFIAKLASMRPKVQLESAAVESLGKGVFRVTVYMKNTGQMPAMTAMGEQVKWVQLPKIELQLGKDHQVISGNKIVLLPNLKAGEVVEFSWLINGKGSLKIEAGAPQMGKDVLTVDLK